MLRIRTMFSSMAAALVLMVLVTATLAQAPGSGGQGGGRAGAGGGGGRGFGGPGFGGPGGGRGGSLYGLLDNPAVQEDLKITDKQKEQIKTANEAINKKRQAAFAGLRGNNNGGGNGGGGNAGGRQRPDMEAMRAAMQDLQAQTDATFGKILTKAQRSRLTQIDLQRQGPMAVLRPDIAEKLNVSDDQMADMQAIQSDSRDMMKQAFQSQRANRASFRTPDGGFDREAMKKQRESPEGKAQMEQMRKQMDQLQNQTIAAIGKVLTKKQKDNFKKMQGKPFDLTKLGGPGGPGANTANGTAATAADAADKTKTATKASAADKKKATRKGTRKAADAAS